MIKYILFLLISFQFSVESNIVENCDKCFVKLQNECQLKYNNLIKEIREKISNPEILGEINQRYSEICEVINPKNNSKSAINIFKNENSEQSLAEMKDEFDYKLNTSIQISEKRFDYLRQQFEEFKQNFEYRINTEQNIDKDNALSDKTSCGDWVSFKEEKCFKIFNKEELLTFDNAVKSCTQLDSSSNLISITSKEEQEFLVNYIFNENKIEDEVWLGSKRVNSSSFKWLDNSEMRFSNWAENSPNRMNGDCAQLRSGTEYYANDNTKGIWADVSCTKKSVAVCQKLQNWSFVFLQSLLIETRKGLEETKVKLQEVFSKENKSENEIKELSNQLSITKKDFIFPIGFIHIQMPNQKSPQELWPSMTWTDISKDYANVFFRVIGDKSESFGRIQDENQSSITKLMSRWEYDRVDGKRIIPRVGFRDKADIFCPKLGWSDWIYTGNGQDRVTRFYSSGGEVRPINMAIKVWKRTN